MERQQLVLNIDAEMLARYDFTFLINADGAKLGTLHVSHSDIQWQPTKNLAASAPATYAAVNTPKRAEERQVNVMCLGMAKFEITETGETFEVAPEQLNWDCENAIDAKLDTAYCHTAHFRFHSPSTPQEVHISWKIWESAAGLERKRKTQKDDSVTLLQNFLFGLAR